MRDKNMKIVLTRSMLAGDIQYIRNGLDKEIAGEYRQHEEHSH